MPESIMSPRGGQYAGTDYEPQGGVNMPEWGVSITGIGGSIWSGIYN